MSDADPANGPGPGPDDAPADPEEQLRTRVAWFYYVEGQTQAEVAERLGVNRIRVNRLLAACREEGMVQIRITSRLAGCIELERRLVARFGIADAIVVPSPADPARVPWVLGQAAGHAVSDRLTDHRAIGVGWGRTLRYSLRAMRRRPLKGLSVVSLLGGLTRASSINTYETSSHLADLFGAECFYLAAPAFASTEASRDVFLSQDVLMEVYQRGKAVDLALVSVGDVGPESTIDRLGLVAPDEMASLRAAGAVGDLLGHFIDRQGRIVDHPVNRRVIGLSPDDLRQVPQVILASGGPAKVPALEGALAGGYVDLLITDERTAAALVDGTDWHAARGSDGIEVTERRRAGRAGGR